MKFFPCPTLTAVFWFQELRIATTLAVVTGLFIICWTPFFGINLASALCLSSSIGCARLRKTPLKIIRITKWLHYGNSVCNPIVHGLHNREFRQTFRKILLGLCCKKAPLYDNRNNANENPYLQRQSPNRLVLPALLDRRESNRREIEIQSRRIQPVSLEFADALHGVSLANNLSTCPEELCNLVSMTALQRWVSTVKMQTFWTQDFKKEQSKLVNYFVTKKCSSSSNCCWWRKFICNNMSQAKYSFFH